MARFLGWVFWHVRLPRKLAPIWFGWYLNASAREQGHGGTIRGKRVK